MDDRTTEAIWRAFGAAAPFRIGVTPPRPGEIRDLPHPFALVGRDSRCDVALDDDSVSRRHVLLLGLAGRTFGIDLDSREGTLWGETARAYGWLGPGETLTVGAFQVQALSPAAGGEAHASPPFNPLASWPRGRKDTPDLILEVLNPQSRKSRWRIKCVLTVVGRSPDCKMRLMDTSVSSVHCCLVCTPMGLWVIDLLGREGILVNDRPVRFARLGDSDDLRVGRFLFRVRGEVAPSEGSGDRAWAAVKPRRDDPVSDESGPSRLPAVIGGRGPAGTSMEVAGARAGAAENVLVPVVKALRALQKHDQDQHHQTMQMLQAIFALHGEQISEVRSQLDDVLRVLRETRSLPLDPAVAARLAATVKALERSGTTTPPPPARASAEALGAAAGPAPQIYRLPGSRAPEPNGTVVPKAAPRNDAAPNPVAADPGRAAPRPAAGPVASDAAAAPAPGSEGLVGGDPSTKGEHALFEDGVHSMIRDRLHEIRRERMTLWQKIMDLVGGG